MRYSLHIAIDVSIHCEQSIRMLAPMWVCAMRPWVVGLDVFWPAPSQVMPWVSSHSTTGLGPRV
jgi:hypothetical protein